MRALDRFVCRLLPSACYYGAFPELDPATIYTWNELDTHDMLTDWFKHYRSLGQIRITLERLGFIEIECWHGGNGVEARARKPHGAV